jgi:hypothetical protein
VRPGARYRCFGDGLCCSTIHAVGPIGRREAKRLEVLSPGIVRRHAELGAKVVAATGDACTIFDPLLPGCRLHAGHGPSAKPSVCLRFPYRLIETPDGLRISTEHRCPCRTMGDRPPIDLDDARTSIGRLDPDLRVPGRITLAAGRHVAFATYARIEAELLARLAAGDDPAEVLGEAPFPELASNAGPVTWRDVGHLYRARLDGSIGGDALAWFGDALLVACAKDGEGVRLARARTWSAAFDRAEARSAAGDPRAIVADWIADEIWGLEWTERGSFETARKDLATRLAIVRRLAAHWSSSGLREDRAAAEAVLVGELAGAAPLFRNVVASFVRSRAADPRMR